MSVDPPAPDLNSSVMYVNRSTDGGLTWGPPIELMRDSAVFLFNDKNSMTADPFDPNFGYAIWDRSRFPSDSERPLDLRVPAVAPQRHVLHPHHRRRRHAGSRPGPSSSRRPTSSGSVIRSSSAPTAPDARRRVHALPRLRREQEGPGDRGDDLRRPGDDLDRSNHGQPRRCPGS